MAQRKYIEESTQYNTEMYMARLVLKNPMVHLCVLILFIYALSRTIFSLLAMVSGGNVLIALSSSGGVVLLAVGSVCALFFSRDGGNRLNSVLTLSLIGGIIIAAASVMEIIFLKADAEIILQTVFTIAAVITASSVLSAAKGNSANTVGGLMLGLSGLALLLLAVFTLISVWSTLRGCFESTYNWSFITEEIDVNTTQIKWYFLASRMSGTTVKAVFITRFIERIAYIVLLVSVSSVALKMVPYINKEKRTVEFAQDAGDFSAFDGSDFRRISKSRTSENVRNQSYYGIGSIDRNEAGNSIDKPEEKIKFKTNEYGDYLDEETGIFYYYDDRTGKYYYLNEKTGEYVYKTENRLNMMSVSSEAMPWELSDAQQDDEDNIYNY